MPFQIGDREEHGKPLKLFPSLMRKGLRLNRFLEARMIWVVGSGLLLGAVFHQWMAVLKPVIPLIFAYITFAVALGCGIREFGGVLKAPGPMLGMLGLLHLALPLGATLLAGFALTNQPQLQAGIVLGTATPVGVSSVIWVGLASGNPALALTTIVVDTMLSPLVVPAIMLVLMGCSVRFDAAGLMLGLVWMVVIPTILGIAGHQFSNGRSARKWLFVNGPLTKLLIALVIGTNLAVAWGSLHLLKETIPAVIMITLIMGCLGYLAGFGAAKLWKLPPVLVNTFIFTVGMRNITAGLVMALRYFPAVTAIPVVFATLFQQPLAALSLRFLVGKDRRKTMRR
jgi:BASS family bile acid:Na+ symporter